MGEEGGVVTIQMPRDQDPDDECIAGARVHRFKSPAIAFGDNIGADPEGDYEVLKREPIPGRDGWWQYTIKKID